MPDSPASSVETSQPLRRRNDVILQLRGLEVSYGLGTRSKRILHGVDLDICRGEIVGLIGETGSGKTTLVRSILGAVPVTAGSIEFEGFELSTLKGRALRDFRRSGKLQYVFQDPLQSLDPDICVGESVAEGLQISGKFDPQETARRVTAALQSVGMDPELASRNPRELSGGQRQRVVIARALILDPLLLLLDEPVSALDSASRVQVLRLLKSLGQKQGIAQVFVSHDLGSVAGIADRIAVLYQGHIVEAGATDEVLRDPQHPYTQLLLGSAPTLKGGSADSNRRQALREALAEQ